MLTMLTQTSSLNYLPPLSRDKTYVSASLTMSTSVLKALPGKLDIKRHSPSILYMIRNKSTIFMSFYVCVIGLFGKGAGHHHVSINEERCAC